MQNATAWVPGYQQQLNYISTALISAGVIYLLAANWFVFPQAVQLAIPQFLLVIASLLTVYFAPSSAKGHCSAAFAALSIGLCFATYGQVYQTGADSFQLFAVWSLLLIPWLYFKLPAVWTIFYITTFLTLYLANKQWLDLSNDGYLLYLSILSLLLMGLAQLFCRSSRLLLILIIAPISICNSIIDLFDDYYYSNINFAWLLISFILPLSLATLFYFQRWSAGLAISLLTIAINGSFWLIFKSLIISDWYAETVIFIIAAIIFVWCWIVSKILHAFLPNNISWSALPAIFGAWLCSVLLNLGFYLLLGYELNLGLGIVILIVGFALLTFQNKNLFIRQSGYALTLCGQLMLFTYILFEHHWHSANYTLLLFQLVVLICSWFITSSQFWRTLQCLIFIGCYFFNFESTFIYLSVIPIAVWIILPTKIHNPSWRRPVLFWLLAVAVGQVLNEFMQFIRYSYHDQTYINQYLGYLLPIIIVLVTLIAVVKYKDNLMKFMTFLALATCLWLFYYSLHLPLINKGVLIISSGLFIGAVSYFINKTIKGTNS